MGESVRSKHTPGPWEVFDDVEGCEFPGIDNAGESIVLCGSIFDDGGIRGDTKEERLANARLIAAAPELLEAVERLLIGAAACAIPHPKEREVLQMAVDFAIQAKRKAKGGA